MREKVKPRVKAKDVLARVDKSHKWKGNILRLYAEEFALNLIKEDDIIKNDMTYKFGKELLRQIKQREIIKMQINAKPRLGKSTQAIMIGMWVHEMIKEFYPKQWSGKEFGMKNIARDDQEYVKKMRDPKLMFDVIVVDESNALEQGGENATVEQQQKEVFSDVQAGRYVHTIYVCPEGDMDKNSDIKLEIRNKQNGIIHNYLYYKMKGVWYFIGFVDIKVDKLIENWVKKVEKRFYSFLKFGREEDQKFIDKWSSKDFYVQYMIKKYEKMELMNKEGVLRPRELDYAELVLNVVNKTKDLVKIMSMNKLKMPIQSYVEMEFKKMKIPSSMLGVEMSTRRVGSVLTMYKTVDDIHQQIKGLAKRLKADKIDPKTYNKSLNELTKHSQNVQTLLEMQVNELERYRDINNKYNKIK